jgi:hypothetical protein
MESEKQGRERFSALTAGNKFGQRVVVEGFLFACESYIQKVALKLMPRI